MFNLDALKLNSRRAAAFGAMAIGAVAFSGFRCGFTAAIVSLRHDAAGESAPQQQLQAAPSEDKAARSRCRRG